MFKSLSVLCMVSACECVTPEEDFRMAFTSAIFTTGKNFTKRKNRVKNRPKVPTYTPMSIMVGENMAQEAAGSRGAARSR